MNLKKTKLAQLISADQQSSPVLYTSASLPALVLLGVIGSGLSGVAQAVPVPADACGPAVAGQSSSVLDAVEAGAAPGTSDYGFRVCNTSFDGGEGYPAIRDWELPFFGTDLVADNEAGITDIVAPAGWFFELEEIGTANAATGWDGVALWQEDGDPMKAFFDAFFGGAANNPYNFHTHVLHFYTPFFEGEFFDGEFWGGCFDPLICTGDSLAGFGFTSDFGPTNAPYQASWVFQPIQTGDPAFPLGGQSLSPTIQNALNNIPIPEPSSMLLWATGGLLLGASAKRRKK